MSPLSYCPDRRDVEWILRLARMLRIAKLYRFFLEALAIREEIAARVCASVILTARTPYIYTHTQRTLELHFSHKQLLINNCKTTTTTTTTTHFRTRLPLDLQNPDGISPLGTMQQNSTLSDDDSVSRPGCTSLSCTYLMHREICVISYLRSVPFLDPKQSLIVQVHVTVASIHRNTGASAVCSGAEA